ncbi:hypothetical protein AZJ80_02845 [Streptococcus pneumoniae]|nr:hypothetical protein AZJ80_02845 [Streptococcus pneumoniae]
MNAKPVAYPILGHKHSTAMSGIEPKETSERNHLPVTAKTRPKPRKNIINIKETPIDLSLDNTILPCEISHFLAIYLQISPKILR